MHFLGPDSIKSARVAAGAQQQNKLWSFVETFYANQGTENSGYATDEFLKNVATTAGVNADAAMQYAGTSEAEQALTTPTRPRRPSAPTPPPRSRSRRATAPRRSSRPAPAT